jgi:hypothetical protein
MGRLAFAVLLLLLELVGWASAANADARLEGKASLMSGVAPPSQLGTGVANASPCLNGNSTWRSCGGSSPAGITYATTAQNWTQTVSRALTGGTQAKVTLTPCPTGIDTTSGAGYQVVISGGGNSEAINVVSGSCVSGAPAGTITFTPHYPYPAGSTVGSASSGIQETVNAACGVNPQYNYNSQCNVTIPANGPYLGSGNLWSINNYFVYGTIFLHSNQSILDGSGATLNCLGRGPCIQVGDRINANDYANNTIRGLSFRTPTDYSGNPSYAGVNLSSATWSSGVVTVTTASPHGFRVGDMVTQLFTDSAYYWGDVVIKAVPTTTTYTYSHPGSIPSLSSTPGVVALAYEAFLDNGNGSHFENVNYDVGGDVGHFNNFFDFWDDENASIDHFNNNAINLNASATWTGSFVFSGGAGGHGTAQNAPVITLRDSNITANYSNGVTVYNSNGLYIENTVIQASGPWQVYSSNSTGNYQGAYLKNIYSESGAVMNPLTPAHSPFAGTGVAGLIAGITSGAGSFRIAGTGTLGQFANAGSGSHPYSYFIVANDTTAGTQTSPMQVLNWLSTGSDSIPVHWPRVANGNDTITYDVIRTTTPVGIGAVYPYVGGCLGGSGGTCGYLAQGLTQSRACSGGLVCTYTDSGAAATFSYSTKPTTHPLQGNYAGSLIFWPGSIVSVNKSVTVDVEVGNVVGVGLSGNPIQVATQCSGFGAASPGGYSACLASVTTPNNSVKSQTATLLSDGVDSGGGQMQTKGRLNFTISPFASLSPHHIVTLIDSQSALTQSTSGYRPPASANDVWIGTDVPARGVGLNAGQLAFGAPVSITNYIGATGDGLHADWLERLTSKQKTFAVPVKIGEGNSFTLGDGSPLSQMKVYSVNNMRASHVPPQSCVDVVGEAKGLTKSDQITSITPPGRLGNLSLNAYPADEGAIILHFCNPSGSEVITPPGAYSFLAVR